MSIACTLQFGHFQATPRCSVLAFRLQCRIHAMVLCVAQIIGCYALGITYVRQ